MNQSSGLFDMMADLAKKNQVLDKFKSSPEERNEVMDDYGLSAEQKALINSMVDDDKTQDFLKAVGDEAHAFFYDPVSKNLWC